MDSLQRLAQRNKFLEGQATRHKEQVAHLEARVIELDAILQRERADREAEAARARRTFEDATAALKAEHAEALRKAAEALSKATKPAQK